MKTIYKIDNINDQKILNEFRDKLVKQFNEQASNNRINARLAERIGVKTISNAKAESYEFVVECLKGIEFSTGGMLQRKKMCPDTQMQCDENCGQMDCHLKLSKAGLFDIDK